MKKILALALAIMLALSATAVVWAEEEESNWVAFEPDFANREWTSSYIFENEFRRAYASWLLIFDLLELFKSSDDPDLTAAFKEFGEATVVDNSSYVGRSGDNLLFVFTCSDKMASVAYKPVLDTTTDSCVALYKIDDVLSDDLIEYFLEKSCTDGYHKNDEGAMLYILRKFTEALD